jgi:hypothetical protein
MSGKKDVQSTNPQAGLGIPLPKKETDLFRQVVRLYETKQYKKGLKLAESILKKFPNHGETLCMKGLVLNSMDKANREDAIATVKLGLRNDMRCVDSRERVDYYCRQSSLALDVTKLHLFLDAHPFFF